MAAGSIIIDLLMKTGSFETDTKRATKSLRDFEKATKSADASSKQMADSLGFITSGLKGLAGAFTVRAIFEFVKATINSVDALNDLKDATGASIENISALEDVAGRTGTSFDTVSTALVKFNNALKEAKPGSDTEAALNAIGLSAKELKTLDPAEALLKTATALSQFADDGNKARLTQELFGKSLREVAPFLKDLAEQGKLVATVTKQQAEEAEKFNKEIFAMQKNVQDLARVLAGDLVRSINVAADAFRTSGLVGGFAALFGGDQTFKNNKQLVELTDELLTAQNNVDKAKHAGSTFFINLYAKEVEGIQKKINALQQLRDVENPNNQSAAETARLTRRPSVEFNGAATKAKGGGKSSREDIDDASRSLAQYVEGLQRQLDKNEELTASEKALNFLKELGTKGQIPQVRELVLSMAGQIDKNAELIKQEKELLVIIDQKREASIAAGDAVNKSNEEYQALLGRLLAATPTAKLADQRKDVEALTDEFTAGRISEQLYLEALAPRLDLTSDKLEKTTGLAEELGLTFSSAFEDAIVGGKGLSEVLKGLEQDILRIVTRDLVTKPLANALGGILKGGGNFDEIWTPGSGGFLGGIVGGIGKLFGGGAAASTFTGVGFQPYAAGTDYVPKDMIAKIHRGERIIPAAENAAGGWGKQKAALTVIVNQSFAPGTNKATVIQAAAQASRQLSAAGRNL